MKRRLENNKLEYVLVSWRAGDGSLDVQVVY